MKTYDVMLDLETLSTAPTAAAFQVGLQAFDIDAGVLVGPGLRVRLNLQELIDSGFTIDWETIQWWARQECAAQVLFAPEDGMGLPEGLALVADYLIQYGGDRCRVWANGAAFDPPILDNMFLVVTGTPAPWGYNKVMDVRTLRFLSGDRADDYVRPDTPHDALSDSRAQAQWVINMMRTIKIGTPDGEEARQGSRAAASSNVPEPTDSDKLVKLGEIFDRCGRADWFHMMSDDARVDMKGRHEIAKLKQDALAIGPEAVELVEQFEKSMWGKVEHPEDPRKKFGGEAK